MALSDVMNAFSMGSGKTQQDYQQQQPAMQQQVLPGNITPGTGQSAPAAGNTDANGVIPPSNNDTPLDEFKSLWETDPNATPPSEFGILGEINSQKIQEVAGKVNFASNIKKEDIALIRAGGDEALAALGRAMNSTAQGVYAQSAVATSKLIEKATDSLRQEMLDTLPARIKKQDFSNSLREDNPAYSHPAAAPIVKMIEDQMSAKYPNATSLELKTLSQEYFTRTFSAISGADKKKADSVVQEYDWESDFLL